MKISKMPFIKWSGSKRKQASYIVNKFPKEINTYYEPFLGGGSVMHELLNQIALGNIKCNKLICSDLNKDLIDVWNIFKNNRQELFKYYTKMYNLLKDRSKWNGIEPFTTIHTRNAQSFYYETRDKYNTIDKDDPERPYIFYWITRTCFNGLIRYNPKTGNFNTPFHVGGGLGISPESLSEIFEAWGSIMDNVDIEFVCDSYENVIKNAKEGDLVYMDPPYEKFKGMYFCMNLDTEQFWNELQIMNDKHINWLLSYDGITGEDDRTVNVPNQLYKVHEYVENGHSNFKKLKSKSRGKENKDVLKDSLYINYDSF